MDNFGGAYNSTIIQGLGAANAENELSELRMVDTQNSTFQNFRDAFVAEYAWKFGTCSNYWRQAVMAWHAVNLGPVYSCRQVFLAAQPRVVKATDITEGLVKFVAAPTDSSVKLSYSWIVPPTWTVSYGTDKSEITVTGVSDYSSQMVSCLASYTVGSDVVTDTVTTFLHFVDCETDSCDFSSDERMVQNHPTVTTAQSDGVEIFPNPAKNTLNINFSALSTNTTATILDVTGKVVLRTLLTQQQNTLPLPVLQTGVYIVKIKSDNCNVVKKIIVSQ